MAEPRLFCFSFIRKQTEFFHIGLLKKILQKQVVRSNLGRTEKDAYQLIKF